MTHGWDPENQGILVLPSGRLVRARALRKPIPDGPSPDSGSTSSVTSRIQRRGHIAG